MISKTIFSPCRTYRYTLLRRFGLLFGGNSHYVMFIGLNPSTADENKDDPTIRRCIGFAQFWGFNQICMTNLFAFRATDPKTMKVQTNPIGPDNDKWLMECAKDASVVVAAWGVNGQFLRRDLAVSKMIGKLSCLGVTKDGHPKHPLYVKADKQLEKFTCLN